MSKTVKQLSEELEAIKKEMSNVQLTQCTVWHWEQVAVNVEKYSRYGELIKMEITVNHGVDKNEYRLAIWHRPLLNEESRLEESRKGNYYHGIETRKDRML